MGHAMVSAPPGMWSQLPSLLSSSLIVAGGGADLMTLHCLHYRLMQIILQTISPERFWIGSKPQGACTMTKQKRTPQPSQSLTDWLKSNYSIHDVPL